MKKVDTDFGVSVSPFAAALRMLMDDTQVFSRDEWADVLGVSSAAISQWVNDHTVPRATVLRSLLDVLRQQCGETHPALQRFREVASQPAEKVSPHGKKMRPTVGHYIVTPVLEGFHRVLQTIPPDRQEQVLFRAAAECRRLRPVPTNKTERDLVRASWAVGGDASSPSINVTTDAPDPLDQGFPVTTSTANVHDPLVGREAELRAIRDSLASQSCVLIVGAAGVGKSALAAELLRGFLVESPGESVHRIECRKHGSPVEFWGRLLGMRVSRRTPIHDVTLVAKLAARRKRNLYLVLDDLDEARADVIASVGDLIGRVAHRASHAKIILTCRDTACEMVYEQLSKAVEPISLTVPIHKLRDIEIGRLWELRAAGVGVQPDIASIRRVVWLSSGSPGYCSGLADNLKRMRAGGNLTEEGVRKATVAMLSSGPGLHIVDSWHGLSNLARVVAVCCAFHEAPSSLSAIATDASGFLRQRDEPTLAAVRAAVREITEGKEAFVEESEPTGASIKLRDEAKRPYLRSLAWIQLGVNDFPEPSER